MELYKKLHIAMKEGLVKSCHDLSDGGLAVAVAESAFGGQLGAELNLDSMPFDSNEEKDDKFLKEPTRLLFSETPSRFVVSIAAVDKTRFEELLEGTETAELGKVTGSISSIDNKLRILKDGSICMETGIKEIENAWKSFK